MRITNLTTETRIPIDVDYSMFRNNTYLSLADANTKSNNFNMYHKSRIERCWDPIISAHQAENRVDKMYEDMFGD